MILLLLVLVGWVLYLVWPPLLQGAAILTLVLFFAYELRKRVFRTRSDLVWFPTLLALVVILFGVKEGLQPLWLIVWFVSMVAILKIKRSGEPREISV